MHMDVADAAILLVVLAISATINVGLGIAWFRANARLRRLERREDRTQPDERALQMERAMDAIAAQVDQLASSQEFLNRIVAERRELPREITPH
jgi:hypothetical protein